MKLLSVEDCVAPAEEYYEHWRKENIEMEIEDEDIEEIIQNVEKLAVGETYSPDLWTVDVTRVQ